MSRWDGLVQRRSASHSTSAGDVEGAHGRGAADDEVRRRTDEEDIDSKETRFTLMEEVLLLGLKDEQVTVASILSLVNQGHAKETMVYLEL